MISIFRILLYDIVLYKLLLIQNEKLYNKLYGMTKGAKTPPASCSHCENII